LISLIINIHHTRQCAQQAGHVNIEKDQFWISCQARGQVRRGRSHRCWWANMRVLDGRAAGRQPQNIPSLRCQRTESGDLIASRPKAETIVSYASKHQENGGA